MNRKEMSLYYISTAESEPALVAETGEKVFRMNSAYSPSNEAAVWGGQFEESPIKRMVCLFGLGTGLFAQELLKKLSSDSLLVIFEPDRRITDYCLESGAEGEPAEKVIAERITDIIKDGRVKLCIKSEDKTSFRNTLLTELDYYLLENLTVTKHTVYDRLFESDFLEFLHTINDIREQILVTKNTLARFKGSAAKNVLSNMWIIEKMNLAKQLGEILPKEVPAIIVSAGPSLDKNVELLRKAKGHCLILAVDTAIPYLLQRDIIPDLTITVEPIKPLKHYQDPRSEEIPAVFDCESNPEIVGKHRSRIFIYNCRGFVKRMLEAAGKNVPDDISGGGSVATVAFALLYELEVKHIILIGQDLAYSGEATHAGGVESKGINNNIGYEMIEDIYGGQVRTRIDWLGYLHWFEGAIREMKELGRDITVTDATEGGAKIHGSEILTLAEALEKYCCVEYDFKKALIELNPFLSPAEFELFLRKKEEAFLQLDEIKKQAGRAVGICNRLLEMLEWEEGDKERKKDNTGPAGRNESVDLNAEQELRKIRAFCESCFIYPMINDYAVSDIAEEVSRLRLSGRDERQRRINEIRQQHLAFEAIGKACDDIININQDAGFCQSIY